MNHKFLVVALIASIPFRLLPGTCDAGESRNTIRVTGEATIATMPNYTVIKLDVFLRDKNLAAAKKEQAKRLESILQIAKSFGIESKDVTTHTATVEKQYVPAEGADAKKTAAERFAGYDLRQKIDLTVYDLKLYKQLLDKIVGSSIAGLEDVDYRNTENRKYQDQARVAAIKAAREKAVLIAGALDQKVGKALKIDDDSEGWGNRSISGASGLENQYIIGGVNVTQGAETEYPIAGLIAYREKVCAAFELQ